MLDRNAVVFVEVRYRKNASHGDAARFETGLVGAAMAWASGVALVLVTLWIMIQGYRMITGQSRDSMMAMVMNMTRIVIIVTAATSASIFGSRLQVLFSADGSGSLGAAISSLVSGDGSPVKAIDRNMAATQLTLAAIDVVQVAPGDTQSADQKAHAMLMASFGAAGPAMAAGAMLLLYQFTIAIFVGFGPIFILCLIFDQTKDLFRKWLMYGIGTLFSIAMLCVVTSIVLKLTENVAAALWTASIVNKITGLGAEGFTSQAMQQGGIGLLLTVLVISVPPLAAAFFQGTVGGFMHFSAFGGGATSRPGPQGQPAGSYGGSGAAGGGSGYAQQASLTGYQGTAYKRLDSGEIIVAHRGTEFDREPMHDGGVDAGMVLVGVSAQTADAMAFTKRVIEHAQGQKPPFHVSVTGHSLGGTLAEITASRYGLQGETFNAYGAAGLMHGIPAGGHQVVDHVRAGDVVSAGSHHFGEVRIYAAQQDIDRLSKSGYRDESSLLSPRDVVGAIDFSAHSIDNFVPHSDTLGQSIINPESAARYRAHHGMVDRYRNDVMDLRTGLSASWEIPNAAAKSGVTLGRAAAHEVTQGVHAVEHGAQYVAHEALRGARAVEHTAQTVAHTVHDNVVKGVHATEHAVSQGVHAVEHGAQCVAHEAVQGARAVEHGVQHAAQAVEHQAVDVAHAVRNNVSQGMHATERAASQSLHAAEHAAQVFAGDASRAFETLRHPGSLFDDKPAASAPVRLDHVAHPDHSLYQQTRHAVHRLDAEHHRAPDQHSDNLAAALTVAARRDGLSQIHHVALSDDASRAFALEGELNPFKQITHVETAKATHTPIEQSSAAWQQIMQQKQADPVHAPQVTQEPRPQQQPHPVAGM